MMISGVSILPFLHTSRALQLNVTLSTMMLLTVMMMRTCDPVAGLKLLLVRPVVFFCICILNQCSVNYSSSIQHAYPVMK